MGSDKLVTYVSGHLLYVISLLDGRLSRYGYTHIQLHAGSYACCFQSYGRLLNVHPGSYVWWLHWQCCGELTCVCTLAVCEGFPYSM